MAEERSSPHVVAADLSIRPVTAAEWPDLVALFEEPGPQNGCWCMYWRVRRADCQHGFGEGNRRGLKAEIDAGHVPGILGYLDSRPVAWCSVAPRDRFPVLDRSRTLGRVDERPVWSITCFFVARAYRRRGLTEALLRAAIDYAAANGATVVEAYPLATEITKLLPYERYMGIASTFERVGFQTVVQRSSRRPLMQYTISAAPA